MRPEWLMGFRVVMLSGAAIYLIILGVTMIGGTFTWHADYLGTHGEAVMVVAFGTWCALEAIWNARSKM